MNTELKENLFDTKLSYKGQEIVHGNNEIVIGIIHTILKNKGIAEKDKMWKILSNIILANKLMKEDKTEKHSRILERNNERFKKEYILKFIENNILIFTKRDFEGIIKNKITLLHYLCYAEMYESIRFITKKLKFTPNNFLHKDNNNNTELDILCHCWDISLIITISEIFAGSGSGYWKPKNFTNINKEGKSGLASLCKFEDKDGIIKISNTFDFGDEWKIQHCNSPEERRFMRSINAFNEDPIENEEKIDSIDSNKKLCDKFDELAKKIEEINQQYKGYNPNGKLRINVSIVSSP